tara:strand:- start:538 stop:1047 length:510 start_codon:yes stop_codon:yes gene_type:complete
MKITKEQLQQIIKEELETVLEKRYGAPYRRAPKDFDPERIGGKSYGHGAYHQVDRTQDELGAALNMAMSRPDTSLGSALNTLVDKDINDVTENDLKAAQGAYIKMSERYGYPSQPGKIKWAFEGALSYFQRGTPEYAIEDITTIRGEFEKLRKTRSKKATGTKMPIPEE